MKILITGATGFVGKHLIPELLLRGHELHCVSRSESIAKTMPWYSKVEFHILDFNSSPNLVGLFSDMDALVHLAWPGLANFKSTCHMEQSLPESIKFLRAAIESGLKQVLVSGTCLEYGMNNGRLKEDDCCDPIVPYAIAKDSLRRYLQVLQNEFEFNLQWVRLFYIYGPYQSQTSLLSQLDEAIDDGEKVFNMSKGDQLRDFIPIEIASSCIASILENRSFSGTVNCCSGKPTSVRALVENKLQEREVSLELNLGYYPYPDYEPMAFWG
ncbi:MAG: NAD-dependent epimerase/dehydratase family protein, partial [Gammaproteobacteria bacterium]|nr:NAD-dependent epimerase/dehydratase family protein [Gammaproteobacteria bacterium]